MDADLKSSIDRPRAIPEGEIDRSLFALLPIREPSAERGTGTFCSQGIAK
jgi:hypothetical protein